jgi:hypothetical protein
LLKNESGYPKNALYYSWRIKNWGQKKEKKFDFLIGLAMDDAFVNPKFYIFTYDEANSVDDVHIPHFTNVRKKICIFKNKKSLTETKNLSPKLITKPEIFINEHQKLYLNKWNKIK